MNEVDGDEFSCAYIFWRARMMMMMTYLSFI